MNFSDELKNEVTKFTSGNSGIMFIYTEDTISVFNCIAPMLDNAHFIYTSECGVINEKQRTVTNDTKICVIHRPEKFDVDFDSISNQSEKQVKFILLSSDRRFIYQYKKYSDVILYDRGSDFSEYLKYTDLNLLEQLYLYVLTDGTEIYRDLFERKIDSIMNTNSYQFSQYMQKHIYSEAGILHDKPIRDIAACFKTPSNYIAIMYAIASGCKNSGDISKLVKIKQTTVSKYLSQLQNYGFIEYITPLDASENSKRGRYRIISSYHHLWFRFMYESMYIYGDINKTKNRVKKEYKEYLIENHLIAYMKYIISTKFTGKKIIYKEWWNGDFHIDIVGICEAENTLYIGQYYRQQVCYDNYYELMSISGKVKGYEHWKKVFVLFSYEGFDDELHAVSNANNHIILEGISLEWQKQDTKSFPPIPQRRKSPKKE